MEPMSMKKKKKGGGYNLRKSIAWNRAFFTDEGVLDPEELSLISGTHVSSSTEGISSLKEEAMDSIDEGDEFIGDSANLQELEKHLFRVNPSVPSQESREIGYLPVKHTSPACSSKSSTSKASHKVTPQAKRAGFISGASPSPLPSSSLKRPANVNACKPVSEDSRIPKVPVSKPRNISFLSSSKSSVSGTASPMKSQILRPVVNKQRISESKSYKRSVNTPQKKTEDSDALTINSSALHVKRNKVNPPLSLPVSTHLRPPKVNKVENSGLKVIREDSLHPTKEHMSENQYTNARPTDSLTSKNVITGRALQQTRVQSNKPSGLRMPSPSLGYFDQPKVSSSNKFSRRNAGSLPRVGSLCDKGTPAKLPHVNSNMSSVNSLVSVLRYNNSSESNTSTRSSDDVAEVEKKWREILDKREHYVPKSDKKVMHITGSEQKAPHQARNEISTTSEDGGGVFVDECKKLLANVPCILGDKISEESTGEKDSQLLSQINFEQRDTDAAETRTKVKIPSKEEKSSNSPSTEHAIAIENEAMSNSEVLSSAMSSSSTSLSCVPDLHQPPPCLGDDLQAPSAEKYAVPDAFVPILEEVKYEKMIEYPHNSESGMVGDKLFKIEEHSKMELHDSSYSSEFPFSSQSKDSIIRDYEADPVDQEAILQIPGLTLSGNIREQCVLQSLETENLCCVSATRVELPAAFVKGEYDSKNVGRLPSAGGLLIEKDECCEENQNYTFETSPLVLSDKRVKSEIHDSDTLMSDVFNGINVEEFHMNKVARLDLPEPGGLPDSRNVSSVAYLSGEPSSLDVLSRSCEASVMVDSRTCRTCDESKSAGQVENRQASLILESNVHEDQRCSLQSSVEAEPPLHASSSTEWGKRCRSPGVLESAETGNIPVKSGNVGNCSGTEDNLGFPALGFEPNLTTSRTSVMCDQYVEGANHTVEPCQPELPTHSIFGAEVPDDKMKLLPWNFLNEEIVEIGQYGKSFASGSGGHNLRHKRKSWDSEVRCSSPISTSLTLNPAEANIDDENGSNKVLCIEDLRSSCTEVLPCFATDALSGGSQLMHDAQLGGSLSQRYSTSPDAKYNSIGPMVSTSTYETQPEVRENRDCLVQDTKCDFITCLENDEKDTSPICSGKSKEALIGRNLTIIPPKNAVPFSDEWLAAVEAAGEEILTIKSGAVQNSPPDKSLPEPSPWSPVKKRNMSIGPYDCTKKVINN